MAEVMVEEMINNATDTVVDGGKFLSFFLGAEEYAIEILKVQEIIGLLPITPGLQDAQLCTRCFKSAWKIVPIMNLRVRFDCQL